MGHRRARSPQTVFSPVLALFMALFMVSTSGCAAAHCQRVRDDLGAFERRPAARGHQDQVMISVPFSLVDPLLTAQARTVGSTSVDLPSVAGVSLGRAVAGVDVLRLRERPGEGIGLLIVVALRSGRQTIVTAEIDAVVHPRLDPKSRRIILALDAKDIEALRPKLGERGSAQLVDFVWKQLPSAARQLTSKSQLAGVVEGVSDPLLRSLADALAKKVLPELGEIAQVGFDLPDLPVVSLQTRSDDARLELRLDTGLAAPDVALDSGAVPGMDPRLVHVRVPGAVAAEIANWAMREGQIPRRYDLAGQPSPNGKIVAALGWEPGPKPLKVRLWATDGDCASGVVSASPRIGIVKNQLVLATDDASLESLRGSLRVRAGVWFSGLGRQSFQFTQTAATSLRADVAGRGMNASLREAKLVEQDLVFGLALSLGRAPARSPASSR